MIAHADPVPFLALAVGRRPLSYFERAFLRRLSAPALTAPASLERNALNHLILRWDSPCPEIGSLWASVTRREIVLSTRISHQHFDRSPWPEERLSGRKLKVRMGRQAAEMAGAVLSGALCDTISYAADGRPYGNGFCPRDRLIENLAYARRVFGEDITTRAWAWLGEMQLEL